MGTPRSMKTGPSSMSPAVRGRAWANAYWVNGCAPTMAMASSVTVRVGPVAEVCDGKDNDCDGTPDNGPDEVCDGEDNDCDGLIDEGALFGQNRALRRSCDRRGGRRWVRGHAAGRRRNPRRHVRYERRAHWRSRRRRQSNGGHRVLGLR